MLSYSQLISWRNLCEYLNERWYKFAYIDEIERQNLRCLPSIYLAQGRGIRQLLYQHYQIQFISYRVHPITNYWGRRRVKAEIGSDAYDRRGWCLVSDWEFKLDFLEQLVLFARLSIERPWVVRLEERIARRSLEGIIARAQAKTQQKRQERLDAGYCPNCYNLTPIDPLMWDCPKCGQSYE